MDTKPRTRAGLGLAGLVAAAALLTACQAGSPSPTERPSDHASVPASGRPAGNESAGNRSTGGFTAEFAACMRAHGVPNFPDPDGSDGQLGPGSGIDPTSPAFRSALNGPCRSLAPESWLASGKVTK